MARIRLHSLIFIGMAAGLLVGLFLHNWVPEEARFLEPSIWVLDFVGKTMFIGALTMIIAPLILASIVAGICSISNAAALGQMGWKTLGYYFCTTMVAVGIGLGAVLTINPGKKDSAVAVREQMAEKKFEEKRAYIEESSSRSAGEIFKQDIVQRILRNPFKSLVEGNSLGIISFAILIGLACVLIGEPARPVADFFIAMNHVMMKITMWLMGMAPVAIGCIIASVVAQMGGPALVALGWYSFTVVFGIAIHIVFLLMVVKWVGKMSPLVFLKGIRNAWMIAFSSTSSAATLPVTIRCVNEELGVDPKVSNFTLPVGATMNMDGTALYEGVAVIFLIQVFGDLIEPAIVLTPVMTLVIFITAVLASVGAAAVPSAGLVTMALVATAVGLPLDYIAYVLAVDHVLDMFRTSTNVMGDAVGAVVVDRLSGPLQEDGPELPGMRSSSS